MEKQTVKETFLELKELVFSDSEYDYMETLNGIAKKSLLSVNDLIGVHNIMQVWKVGEDNPTFTYSNNKDWTNAEKELIIAYHEYFINEKVVRNGKVRNKPMTRMMEELSEIMIDRTSQAISFKYYQKKDEPKETLKQTVLDDFDDKGDKGHIEDSYLIDDILEPVEEDSNDDMNGNPLVVKEDIDLIETVSELVGNIESVGIDINPIFTSLLELSQRAIKNNNIDLVFKVDKLENKIRTTQYRLDEEKEKSEQLQKDFMQLFNNIAKIKEEISYFEGLSSKEKLKNINSFTEKLNYMMNQIGGVVTMTV